MGSCLGLLSSSSSSSSSSSASSSLFFSRLIFVSLTKSFGPCLSVRGYRTYQSEAAATEVSRRLLCLLLSFGVCVCVFVCLFACLFAALHADSTYLCVSRFCVGG